MDISKVKNKKAADFLQYFFQNRKINRDFYKLLPEDKYDFRMVDRPTRKSDSPRESLAHQIAVQRTYLNAIKSGKLDFSKYHDDDLKKLSKKKLLNRLRGLDQEMTVLLSDDSVATKEVKVPWSEKLIDVIDMLWALDSHEALHTGWNIAIMDHLDMERYSSLKEFWGE